MKRKLGIFITIMAFIFAVFFLEMFIRKINNKQWHNRTGYITELKQTNKYNIKRVTNKRLVYQHGDDIAQVDLIPNNAAVEETQALHTETAIGYFETGSYIYVNILKQNIWIETNEYILSEDEPHDYQQWLNIDFNGNIIEKREDSAMQKSADLAKLQKIKNEISNIHNWNDDKTEFFVNHFAKVEFHWSSLNPLRNMGMPNGGSSPTYWRGIAYLNLKMQQELIQFKTETANKRDGYLFDIELYRIPSKYTRGKEVALVYIDDIYLNHKDCGLYLIKEK